MTVNRITVLLVEDDEDDAKLVRRSLRECSTDFQLEWASSLDAAIGRLSSQDFDVVLSDLSLPDSQGGETVARIRSEQPDTPIIVLG